jgi:hypothetical protein
MSAAVTAGAGVGSANRSYVLGLDGSLSLYNGGTLASGIVSAHDAAIDGGIAQVSAGTHEGGSGAVFVRFRDGTVNEYFHQAGSSPREWESLTIVQGGPNGGASEISASQVRADAVFIRMGGLVEEHVGTNPDPSVGVSLIVPVAQPPGPHFIGSLSRIMLPDPSQISAGKDAATGEDAVFINFGGILYEHTGPASATGWKYVTNGVTGLSASQVQGDTVFVIKSGALSEYVNGTGTFITGNVSQVSAGIDTHSKAAAFILTNNHNLYEHTGTDPLYGWTHIASRVRGMDASQTGVNTVFYTVGSPVNAVFYIGLPPHHSTYEIHEHNSKGDTLLFHNFIRT